MIEITTWVFDVLIWISTIPGLLKAGKFGDADGAEIVLWGYRTFVMGLDLVLTVRGWTRDPRNTQRIERKTEATIVLSSILGVLDMMFASFKLSPTFDEANLDGETAIPVLHELLFAVPRTCSFLRFEPTGAVALSMLNIFVAVASSVTGGILLTKDFKALREAL